MQENGPGISISHSPVIATPDAAHTDIGVRRSFSNSHRRSRSGSGSLSETDVAVSIVHTTSQHHPNRPKVRTGTMSSDVGNRLKVATMLTSIADYIGNPAPDRFDDSEFKQGEAVNYPELPGERNRNPGLPQIRQQYNPTRDEDGNLNVKPSRAGSFVGSVTSAHGIEGSSTRRTASPQPTLRSPSPSPLASPTAAPQMTHATTLPERPPSFELQDPPPSPSHVPVSDRGRTPRRATLEVPSPTQWTRRKDEPEQRP